MRLLCGSTAVGLVLFVCAANAASISGPNANSNCGTATSTFTATDQSNPLGFDVTGNAQAGDDGCVVTWATTLAVTLAAGTYQTHIALAGSGSTFPGTYTLTTSTELDPAATPAVYVPGSYVQSSGTYTDSNPGFSQNPVSIPFPGQPGSVDSGLFAVAGGNYILKQMLEIDVSGSGSPYISIDFSEPLSTITPSSSGTPEPTTFALLGAGVGLLLYRRLRRS